MTPEEALDVWAPRGSPWNPWTKPVLFSFLPGQLTEAPHEDSEPEQRVPLLTDAALVVELPSKRGVDAGLSLALRGYRPILLYNASPSSLPGAEGYLESTPVLIDVKPIVKALEQGTPRLREMLLPLSTCIPSRCDPA